VTAAGVIALIGALVWAIGTWFAQWATERNKERELLEVQASKNAMLAEKYLADNAGRDVGLHTGSSAPAVRMGLQDSPRGGDTVLVGNEVPILRDDDQKRPPKTRKANRGGLSRPRKP